LYICGSPVFFPSFSSNSRSLVTSPQKNREVKGHHATSAATTETFVWAWVVFYGTGNEVKSNCICVRRGKWEDMSVRYERFGLVFDGIVTRGIWANGFSSRIFIKVFLA
jgi:hypothetical protein